MLEHVEVRVKHTSGIKSQFKIELPQDRRDDEVDTINDIISDWLDENGADYKWFRILGTCVLVESNP